MTHRSLPPQWSRRRRRRSSACAAWPTALLPRERLVAALEALIAPGDRVVLEGNNQKQADFLSRSLARVDPGKLHDLHMIMPSVGRPEHLDLFELGIARKLDFSFSGPQSLRIGQLLEDGLLEIGAIHTYIELYARLVVDLIPNVALVAGFVADREGNVYTGPSTEDTPALVEPTAFSDGIVIVRSTVSSTTRATCREWTSRRPGWTSWSRPTSRSTSSRCSPATRATSSADGDDGDPRHLPTAQRAVAEPRHRLQHRGHRADPADLRRVPRPEGQDLPALDPQPAPDPYPAIERLGRACTASAPSWAWRLHRPASRRVLHRSRRLAAFQPDVLPTGRAVRGRPVHRRHPPGRRRRPFLHRHPRTPGRLRRRPVWATTRAAGATRRRPGWTCGANPRPCWSAAGSWWCRWSRPSRTAASRPSSSVSTRWSGAPDRHAAGAGDDLWRRRHPCAHRGRHRLPVQGALAGGTPGDDRRGGGDQSDRPAPRSARDPADAPRRADRAAEDLGIRRTDASRELLAAKSIAELVEWSGGLYQPPARFRSW